MLHVWNISLHLPPKWPKCQKKTYMKHLGMETWGNRTGSKLRASQPVCRSVARAFQPSHWSCCRQLDTHFRSDEQSTFKSMMRWMMLKYVEYLGCISLCVDSVRLLDYSVVHIFPSSFLDIFLLESFDPFRIFWTNRIAQMWFQPPRVACGFSLQASWLRISTYFYIISPVFGPFSVPSFPSFPPQPVPCLLQLLHLDGAVGTTQA